MTEQPLPIDVNLDDFRAEISRVSTDYEAALRRMVLTKSKLKAVVLAAIRAGLSENETANLSGVTRKTVRDWQGKK
jgi:hypothetical protein